MKTRSFTLRFLALGAISAAALVIFGCGSDDDPAGPGSEPTIVQGSAADAAGLATFVVQYRSLLGTDNGGEPGTRGESGYREINWDTVPDASAAPNFCDGGFFNAATAPRARGIVLHTPGSGLMVSADADNATLTLPRFGNINPQYANIFKAYSTERLFSPVGSHIVNLSFFVPGTNTPATIRGFGAVYTDVDTRHTAFEYFDRNGNSLGVFETPVSNNGLSFLGVAFEEAVVARVEVRYGTGALGPDDGVGVDVAVMDNFIYGEPQAIQR